MLFSFQRLLLPVVSIKRYKCDTSSEKLVHMSLTNSVTARQVKESYVIAQWLKIVQASLTPENYVKRLEETRARVEKLSASALDHAFVYENGIRKHQDRLTRLDESTFILGSVPLDSCSVWGKMGGRRWATGLVSTVAKRFLIHGEVNDPLQSMMNYAREGHYDNFPIIVYPRCSNPDQFRIDDGNHRAVARYLAGKIEALAYIGIVKGGRKLYWIWP